VSLALPSRRAVLAPPWVKNELWRRARAVPSLDQRFAESRSLIDAVSGQQLITFSRVGDGTFVGSNGLIQTAGTNVPRFTHDPVTLESLGLLVEEQRSNLLLQSQNFLTSWTKDASVTITADNSQGTPIQGSTVYRVDYTGSNQTGPVQSLTYSAISYTGSVWVKGAIGETLRFSGQTGVSAVNHTLNGQWQQVILSWTGAAGAGAFNINTFGGVTARTVWIAAAQLEAGAFATSYIPTTTATVTRSADVASITGSAFSSWYRQDEGTVFAESSSFSNLSGSRVVSAIDDGSMSNRFQITFASGYTPNFAAVSAGTVSADLYGSAPAQGSNTRFCTTYRVNDFVLSSNGGNVVTDTSGALPVSVSTARLGVFLNNTGYLNGTIRRLTYFPQRLSNTTLQALTQ
jgi:hypothetical protein